jgi:hypothetical protein
MELIESSHPLPRLAGRMRAPIRQRSHGLRQQLLRTGQTPTDRRWFTVACSRTSSKRTAHSSCHYYSAEALEFFA